MLYFVIIARKNRISCLTMQIERLYANTKKWHFNNGFLELSVAQFFLGIHILLGRILAPTCPIVLLLAIRFFIGFSTIAIMWQYGGAFKKTYHEIRGLQKSDWVILCLQALCGGFLFNILTLYGLQYTNATTASIINSTTPAFVALFSFLLLKEVLTKNKAFAISLTIIGILLLSLKQDHSAVNSVHFWGELCVFLAIIPGALFIVLGKMLKTAVSPFIVTALVNLLNTFLFFSLAFYERSTMFFNHSWTVWLQILLYSLSGSVLFFVFWYRGLAQVTANTAALSVGLMPIFTSTLAYFILNESLSTYDILGFFCITSSIFIGMLK